MAYGVGIESDLSFDALPKIERNSRTISLRVERVSKIGQATGVPVRPCTAQGRDVHITAGPSYVTVQVDSLFCFELWLSSNRILGRSRDDVSATLLQYWILQQILPLFLLLNGSTEFLHGMAVSDLPCQGVSGSDQRPQSCIGFLGESYAGKSTLLSYFLSRGHALITDDHLALSRDDYTQVLPATPFYRPYRASEDLGLVAASYSGDTMRLERMYLLVPAPAGAAINIERLSGMDAITALFPSIHYSLHNQEKPDFFPLVEDRFRGLADIARRVPVARVHVPRSLDRLPEVYDIIKNDRVPTTGND